MARRPGRRTYPNRNATSSSADRAANVTIESVASGGDGVGRVDGIACFIPRTAPGDTVQAALTVRTRHARGRVLQILSPSAVRVEPTCRHYDGDQCGGCQLQHIDIAAQRDIKSRIVRDALLRIGRRDVGLPRVEPSPHALHYRRKFTLTLAKRGQGWIGGFHPLNDANAVFPLVTCDIADGRLLDAWESIKRVAGSLPNTNALRVMVRLVDDGSERSEKFALVVSGGMLWTDAQVFADALPNCVALWWHDDAGNRHSVREATTGARTAASFVQVNREMAKIMLTHVEAAVRHFEPVSVLDAYAGIGELSTNLANSGVHVTAIEWDRDAIASLQTTLPIGSRAIAASVESVISECLPADVVVLNPPRTGVDIAVTDALANAATLGVRAIVYVSCDPATLARDLTRLNSWRIHELRCFDMFPQTAHVETMCVLVPEAA